MDELAIALGMDPIELRIRNEPDGRPRDRQAVLEPQPRRLPAPRAPSASAGRTRPRAGAHAATGGWLVGTGVAASTYPVYRMPGSEAADRRRARRPLPRARSARSTSAPAPGPRSPRSRPTRSACRSSRSSCEIGDTRCRTRSVAGGSSGITTWGTAVVEAAAQPDERHGDAPGRRRHGDRQRRRRTRPPTGYAMHAFGAQFVEVERRRGHRRDHASRARSACSPPAGSSTRAPRARSSSAA